VSRKNVLHPVLIASSQSLASSFTTTPTIVEQGDNVGYQIAATTSDSIGTFTVQVSMDYQPVGPYATASAGTWSDLVLSGYPSVPNVNAANDVINISLNQPPFKAVRLSYTASTPGTGTANIYVSYKSVGA